MTEGFFLIRCAHALKRNADAAFFFVYLDDLDAIDAANRYEVREGMDVIMGELADMQEPRPAFVEKEDRVIGRGRRCQKQGHRLGVILCSFFLPPLQVSG